MAKHIETEIKVGIFLASGAGLIMTALFLLGGGDSFLTKHVSYTAHFMKVDGLISGAKVILSGVSIGTVDKIDFDPASRDILVKFSVNSQSTAWIRQDATV